MQRGAICHRGSSPKPPSEYAHAHTPHSFISNSNSFLALRRLLCRPYLKPTSPPLSPLPSHPATFPAHTLMWRRVCAGLTRGAAARVAPALPSAAAVRGRPSIMTRDGPRPARPRRAQRHRRRSKRAGAGRAGASPRCNGRAGGGGIRRIPPDAHARTRARVGWDGGLGRRGRTSEERDGQGRGTEAEMHRRKGADGRAHGAGCVKASVRAPKRGWNLAASPRKKQAGPDPTSPTSVTCDARL